MRLDDLVFVDQASIRRCVLLHHYLDRLEEALQAGPLHLRGLFGRLTLCKQDQPVPLREVREGIGHSVQDFRRRTLEFRHALMNLYNHLPLGHVIGKLHVRLLKRAAKAAHAIAVLADVAPLGLIQDVTDVRARVAVRLDERDEILDELLEEDVVLPQRVVGVDEQRVPSHEGSLSAFACG